MSFSLQPGTLARVDHRMQFVLGPRYYEGFDNWRRSEIAGGRYLTSHPDLSVTTVAERSVTITLLGYILDPEAPESGNEEILTRLASSLAEGADVFAALAGYGGRYLLVADAGAPLIVSDPVGTMQLLYTVVDDEIWCAAQPHLLQELFDLPDDPEALAFMDFVKSETDEHSWPADATNVRGLSRLLPNHYLDLVSHQVLRYWPRAENVEGDLEELRPKIVARLQNLMAAAATRFPLAIGVSAGYDSRIILAASREVSHEVVYYTGQGGHRGASHPDIAIPREMLAELGLNHDLIVTREEPAPEFAAVYRRSVSFHHEKRIPGQQTQLDHYRLGRVAVLGNTSEIARRALRNSRRAPPLLGWPSAEHLSLLMAMPHPFAVKHFQRWLDGVGDLHGHDILDLFFWEHRNGMWFSHNCSQFMLGWRDVFMPFNCRALISDMLSVPAAERADMGKTFYISLARQMWPEVLEYSINPKSKVAELRTLAYRSLRNIKRTLFPKRRRLRPSQEGNSPVQDGTNRLT